MNPMYRSRIGSTATAGVLAIIIALGGLPLGGAAQQLAPNLLEQIAAGLLIQKGAEQMNKGNFEAAIALYGLALDVYPQSADTYYQRGVARLYIKANQEAIADFTQAIALNPNFSEAYSQRALVHYEQGELAAAIADYTQMIQLQPNRATAYNSRGLVYLDLQDNQSAIQDFAQATQLDANFKEARCNWVQTRKAHGESVTDLEIFVACPQYIISGSIGDSDNPEVYYDRGLSLLKRGDRQGAIKNLETALKLFRIQRKQARYQSTQTLISRLQR